MARSEPKRKPGRQPAGVRPKRESAKYLKVVKDVAKEKPLTPTQRRAARKTPIQTTMRRPGNKGGRPVGSPNKFPRLLKDALLEAAETVGNKLAPFDKRGPAQSGLVNYLCHQAIKSPNAFMSLLGRVLPLQIDTNSDGPMLIVDRVEYHVVDGRDEYGNELERELNGPVIEHRPRSLEFDGSPEADAADETGEVQGRGGR